ncbi:MAG: hypothetical protein ABMA25_00165 [Ilumatobacteraceae bacterium]
MNTSATPSRLLRRALPVVALTASLGLLGALATTSPAAAVEFAPAATLDVDPSCVNGAFTVDIAYGNVDGLTAAQFVSAVGTGSASYSDLITDVPAGQTVVTSYTANEGNTVTLHITSADAAVPIDYTLNVTVDCIEDTTIPETTVVDSSGGGLPTTGAGNWLLAGVASGLLLAGITLIRGTRRA